jgi:hypothetical protein
VIGESRVLCPCQHIQKGPQVPSCNVAQLKSFHSKFGCFEREVLFKKADGLSKVSMIHQLECPDLVNTFLENCYLDVTLLGNSEKFLWPLKIVEAFIVRGMQKCTN